MFSGLLFVRQKDKIVEERIKEYFLTRNITKYVKCPY